MIKSDEVKGPSCLTNAADDEPIFVLKSTDEVAPGIVREWALRYKLQKQSQGSWTGKQEAKYYEALSLATQMEVWHSLSRCSCGLVSPAPGNYCSGCGKLAPSAQEAKP